MPLRSRPLRERAHPGLRHGEGGLRRRRDPPQGHEGTGDVSSDCSEQKVIEFLPGDILIGNIHPYLRKIWLADDAGGTNGDVLAIRIDGEWRGRLLPRYLYHCLATDAFFHFMMSHVKGSKMPRGNKEAILGYRIPIPPAKAQEEIVSLLDTMLRLEDAIEAELDARRQQTRWVRELVTKGKAMELFPEPSP